MAPGRWSPLSRLKSALSSFGLVPVLIIALPGVTLLIKRWLPDDYSQPLLTVIVCIAVLIGGASLRRWHRKRKYGPAVDEVAFAAAKAANILAETARGNLRRLAAGAPPAELAPFDLDGMAAALRVPTPEGIQHLVVYSIAAEHDATPASLDLLWPAHSEAIATSGMAGIPGQEAALAEAYRSIAVRAGFLAELLHHAGVSCRRGHSATATLLLRDRKDPADHRDLGRLASQHRERFARLSQRLREEFPGSQAVAQCLAAMSPADFPFMVFYLDHEGARVLNHVWFPKDYAEPIMEKIINERAKAMAMQGSSR